MGWRKFLKGFSVFLILLFGLFLFTFKLDEIPNGVFYDEAVVGYDAYSILNTSKDHWGQILPIYFKFFGSYTPGLFVYLQTIPIKFLGLNSFSIRIISALSMLVIAYVFFIFLKNTNLVKSRLAAYLGLIMFLITPWTVFNARIGYETTFAFALISLGVMLYKNPWWSFLLISLSTYTGHTQRYLAPLLLTLIYFVFYFKKVSVGKIVKPLFAAFLIQIPNFILLFTPSFWVKSSSFSSSFITQYASYFSPFNLFNQPDYDLQRSMPEMAVFYSWMFIPWITGFYSIYKNWKKPIYKYLLGLILLAPIPAALANINYSTQRALPLLLPYSILIAIGLDLLIKKINIKYFLPLFFVIFVYSLLLLWRSYFILMPAERAQAWGYGYKELSEYILNNPDKKFIIDSSRGLPYIELLFFTKYPPEKFQEENRKNDKAYYWDTSFSSEMKFANTELRPIDWPRDIYKKFILVGDELAISSDQIEEHYLIKLYEIKDIHGKIIFQVYETNPDLKSRMSKNNFVDYSL